MSCPSCGSVSALRPKLVLVDTFAKAGPPVDGVAPGSLGPQRFGQFVNGYVCEQCGQTFVPKAPLEESRRDSAPDQSTQPPAWEEVAVEVPWNIHVGGLNERWYRNTSTGEVWRLVDPDGPFRGVWERVR